jgi:hypothetical protein
VINRKVSVCLALIHNNSAQRVDYIQPLLAELQTHLSQRLSVKGLEVANQPEIREHGMPLAFVRDVMYQVLDRNWKHYRLLRPRLLPIHIFDFLLGSFKKYRRGATWKRNSFVETVVTDKHIRAWCAFLETDCDFLICFEDDAVFKDDSSQRVTDLLDTLSRRHPDQLVYVDLAGGCRFDELKIDRLELTRDHLFRFYSKPVTNTACAYLMSRPLVMSFQELVTRRPWLRLIGIDWMMNKLFMIMAKNGMECACMHANPTIFKHGTTTGDYVSWQAKLPG